MKVVILAGGMGTRLAEETEVRPKPMVEIGGRPILWHIMKHYAHYGFNEFVIALGYSGESIKRFFCDYHDAERRPDRRRCGRASVERHDSECRRLDRASDGHGSRDDRRAVASSVSSRCLSDGTFMLTYGDGVCDVDLRELLAFHRRTGPHRHGDGRATAGALRRTGVRRRSRRGVHREAADRRRLDQRRLHGARARRSSIPRRTIDAASKSTRSSAWPRTASLRRSATSGSGSAWTRCETSASSRALWQQGRAPWNVWT